MWVQEIFYELCSRRVIKVLVSFYTNTSFCPLHRPHFSQYSVLCVQADDSNFDKIPRVLGNQIAYYGMFNRSLKVL